MGSKSVYCVNKFYYFYAGCTTVSPDCTRIATSIKKERQQSAHECLIKMVLEYSCFFPTFRRSLPNHLPHEFLAHIGNIDRWNGQEISALAINL